MSWEYPRLRYLEAFPHTEAGRQLVVLRDPIQVTDQVLAISPELYSMLTLVDGSRSLQDLQAEWSSRAGGRSVSSQEVETVLQQLDEVYFLENQNFIQHQQLLLQQFRQETVRPAFHAGVSYPDQGVELLKVLGSFYSDEGGGGLPGSRGRSRVRALVAPHIDLRLGGPTYTHAYRSLAESRTPDLFVVLGTAHMGLPHLFSICRKDFQTPLGRARLDEDFLTILDRVLGQGPFEEELAHRNEHTIEFQILFLQHLFPESQLRILPVLSSFNYLDFQVGVPGSQDRLALFDGFIQGLEQAEKLSGKSICFVASVDLAHIGPRYGDPFRPDSRHIEEVSEKDQQMLEFVLSGDAEGFRAYVGKEQDERRICGYSPLYTLLRLLAGRKGRLLSHNHSQMDPSGSFVTYASLVFPEG